MRGPGYGFQVQVAENAGRGKRHFDCIVEGASDVEAAEAIPASPRTWGPARGTANERTVKGKAQPEPEIATMAKTVVQHLLGGQ